MLLRLRIPLKGGTNPVGQQPWQDWFYLCACVLTRQLDVDTTWIWSGVIQAAKRLIGWPGVHRRSGPADQSSDHGPVRRNASTIRTANQPGDILSAISHMGESWPAEVSRILRIEKSTLSRDVELMKQRGWLESEPPLEAGTRRSGSLLTGRSS